MSTHFTVCFKHYKIQFYKNCVNCVTTYTNAIGIIDIKAMGWDYIVYIIVALQAQ